MHCRSLLISALKDKRAGEIPRLFYFNADMTTKLTRNKRARKIIDCCGSVVRRWKTRACKILRTFISALNYCGCSFQRWHIADVYFNVEILRIIISTLKYCGLLFRTVISTLKYKPATSCKLSRLSKAKLVWPDGTPPGFPARIIRWNWNDTEEISMAPCARMTRTNREV